MECNPTRFALTFLLFSTLLPLLSGQQQESGRTSGQPSQKILVGAIRWDAWHGDRSEVGKAVEQSLSPKRWQGRLPFFATILGPNQVRIDGASQKVVDEKVQYAQSAGLAYWAFLLYAEDSPMNLALQYYLASTEKGRLSFCLILEPAHWTTSELAAQQIAQVTELMVRSGYQHVAGSRPLLYLLAPEPTNKAWGARHGRAALDQLRAMVQARGGGNPYVVLQDYRPERASTLRKQWKADAISAYAYQRDDRKAPYARLAQETEEFWDQCRSTRSAVVPLVMTGWDRRPRIEHPVFWEPWQKPNVGREKFYYAPTPTQLSIHLKNDLTWVSTYPAADPARTILIYAWNENDEGGWLVPTLGDGTSRLNAVGKLLKNAR